MKKRHVLGLVFLVIVSMAVGCEVGKLAPRTLAIAPPSTTPTPAVDRAPTGADDGRHYL